MDDEIWRKTHDLGGKLFKATGIIAFAGVLVPDYAIYFMLFPVLIASVYTLVYSYVEYNKKYKKRKSQG